MRFLVLLQRKFSRTMVFAKTDGHISYCAVLVVFISNIPGAK
jgi:hypothetical protein